MRVIAILSGAALTVVGVCYSLTADDAQQATQSKPGARQSAVAPKTSTPATSDAKVDTPKTDSHVDPPAVTNRPVPEKYAADAKAIRQVHESLVKAYSADDAKGVAAHFTDDAEYINSSGTLFQGRDEIEQSLSDFMSGHPGCKLDSEIADIRFVSPIVASVDGTTTVIHAQDHPNQQDHCRFSAIYVKTESKWQVASIRDQEETSNTSHEEQLAQLDFLKGDWIDEDQQSVVSFSCQPVDSGKYLLREFTLKMSGRDVMSGSQRIGWDPVRRQLRTWIFDSDGGFAEGVWQRTGDDWVLKASGVTADGELASGTSIYKFVNDQTMTWQAVDYEIGGVQIPDSPVYTLTHRAPAPGESVAKPNVGLKD